MCGIVLSSCWPGPGWLVPKVCAHTRTRAHTHLLPLSLPPQAIHGHDATPGSKWASHCLRHPQPAASCPSALVWTCRPTIWCQVGTWLHRIPKRCPARKPNGPGSHALAGLMCEGVLSITWHHTCHQCALVSHRIQGTHCHMRPWPDADMTLLQLSPSACCAALPQLMLVTVSDISRSHPWNMERDHGLVFARGST